jgi:hypothetical protein
VKKQITSDEEAQLSTKHNFHDYLLFLVCFCIVFLRLIADFDEEKKKEAKTN